MNNLRSLKTVIVVVIMLLTATTTMAANLAFPREVFGIALGSADIDKAAQYLESQGWVPDVDSGDGADDKKLYLFIFDSDKKIEYWNVNWGSAMYVTSEERPHTIEGVFLMTPFSTYGKASGLFKRLANKVRADYKPYIREDEDDAILMRDNKRIMSVSLRQSSTNEMWFVSLMIQGAPNDSRASTGSSSSGGKSTPTTERKPTSSTDIYPETSSNTIPHSLMGVEIGSTRINDAMKILRNKGYSPEMKEKGEKYITVVTTDSQLKILGREVMMVNLFFSEPKKNTCTDIYCAVLFDSGSEAREFIQSARKDLTAKYGNALIVDETNKLVFRQNGYYMMVERSYLSDSDTWLAWIVFSNSMPR